MKRFVFDGRFAASTNRPARLNPVKLSKAERAVLAKLGRLGGLKGGRKGGKAAAGRGAREAWAKIPPAERSKIMRERAVIREKRRKALAKRKQT